MPVPQGSSVPVTPATAPQLTSGQRSLIAAASEAGRKYGWHGNADEMMREFDRAKREHLEALYNLSYYTKLKQLAEQGWLLDQTAEAMAEQEAQGAASI